MSATAQTPLARQAGFLLAALAAVGLPALGIAYALEGSQGPATVALAFGVALAGGLGALVPGFLANRLASRGTDTTLVSVLGGMFLRMAIPLAAVAVVRTSYPEWFTASWLAYLIVFYLAGLAIETWLSLPKWPAGRTGGYLRKASG